MPLFGFTAEQVRRLTELERRVNQLAFGKGGKRPRWPVPGPGGGVSIIRFRFDEFTSGSNTVALCTVLAPTSLANTQVEVTDATEEGCFFSDETEAELVGRNGYAVLIGGVYEVFSLCCAPDGS